MLRSQTKLRHPHNLVGTLWIVILPLVLSCLVGCTGLVPAKTVSAMGPKIAVPNTPTLQIATNSLPVAAVQSTYSTALVATGDVATYAWA